MRKHIFISGRVQGVGFRHFTKVNARRRDINGWVKNLSDGRVEAVFEGDPQSVQEMVKQCHSGPASSRVEDVEEAESDSQESLHGFEVRY